MLLSDNAAAGNYFAREGAVFVFFFPAVGRYCVTMVASSGQGK